MELTLKTFSDRLDQLRQLAIANGAEYEHLRSSLHEKGVECAIIIPLIEVGLEFDALRDVSYEQSSDSRHGQRFDFLLDDRLLIEAKALATNLDDHYKQITRYIAENTDINYGVLTNGIDYQIWLQKNFIEAVTKAQLPHTPKVAKILEVSLLTDTAQFVLDALSTFKKDIYEQSMKTLASIAGHYASGGRGRPPIIHQDKQVNEILRDRIKDAVAIQKGAYYDDVIGGTLSPGDKLRFSSNCVEITVEITDTGTIILRRGAANVVDVLTAIKDGWGPMISLIADKWSKEDTEFQDPHEIIRLALNKQRLFGKEKYSFKHLK